MPEAPPCGQACSGSVEEGSFRNEVDPEKNGKDELHKNEFSIFYGPKANFRLGCCSHSYFQLMIIAPFYWSLILDLSSEKKSEKL